MGTNKGFGLKALKARMLKDPEVREAYDKLAPEFALAAELIRARKKAKLTQARKKAKLTQARSSGM